MFLVPLDSTPGVVPVPSPLPRPSPFPASSRGPRTRISLASQGGRLASEHGGTDSAVECLLSARDWDAALELILARGSEVFESGEMATVDPVADQYSGVRAGRSAPGQPPSRTLEGHGGPSRLRRGHRAQNQDRPQRLLAARSACAQAFLASLAQWRANHETTIEMADEALVMLDDLATSRCRW